MSSRRRADAARNDELFLDTGLELLRDRGPDRLAALELARSAGLTTGAVYARYENPAEIMVGLWQHRIASPMHMFLENSLEALVDGSDRTDAGSVTARAFSNPNGPLRPGVSVLIAATRIPELAEVVRPDLVTWARELGLMGDHAESHTRRALVAASVGCLLFATTDMLEVDDWDFARRVARGALADRPVGRHPLPAPRSLGDPVIDTGDPVRDAIVNGAARVIAHGGIEGATTQRIARAAGLQPSELFAVYRTRPELFADVARKLLTQIYEGARSVTGPRLSPDDSTSWQKRLLTGRLADYRALFQPQHRDQRLLRLEFHLAAIHEPLIGDTLRKVDDEINRRVAEDFSTDWTIDPAIAYRSVRFVRSCGLGAMLLEELVGGYAELDLRRLFEPLTDLMEGAGSPPSTPS